MPQSSVKAAILIVAAFFVFTGCDVEINEDNFFQGHRSAVLPDGIDSGLKRQAFACVNKNGDTLKGYSLKAKNAGATVIYFTGVWENVYDDYARVADLCRTHTVNAYAVDYRGYGESGGKASFTGLLEDALGIFDAVKKENPSDRIIVFGHSIGTTAAMNIAAERAPDAAILEAVFTNAGEALPSISNGLGWPLNAIIKMKPSEYLRNLTPQPEQLIKRVKCPLLILHGRNDNYFPVSMGLKMYTLAGSENKVFYVDETGGHFVNLGEDGVKERIKALKSSFAL